MDQGPQPVELTKQEEGRAIGIQWSDGLHQELTARRLRDDCPCATCREKAEAKSSTAGSKLLPILTEAELQPLRVTRMEPTGSYAYLIEFSDGHRSGIFTLERLRQLG